MHYDPRMVFWMGLNFLILFGLPLAFALWVVSTLNRMRRELQEIRATLKEIAGRLDRPGQP